MAQSPDITQRLLAGFPPGQNVGMVGTPVTPGPDQIVQDPTSSSDALTRALIASQTQGLQAQLAAQQANYGVQAQQAMGNEQYQLSQLVPQLGNVAAQGDLVQAQIRQQAPFQEAKLADALAGRGLGTSGINLGAQGRLQAGIAGNEASTALKTNQSTDALSRQITALQQQTAGNVAGLTSRASALGGAGGSV